MPEPPGVASPYADDLNLAVKHALPRGTGTATLTYTRRAFKDLLDDFVGDEERSVDETDPIVLVYARLFREP